MGKRNQITSEEDLRDSTTGSTSPKKKHKHKHKKHKKKRELTESESLVEDEPPKKKKHKRKEKEKDEGRSLKLKIKLGGRTLATKQVRTLSSVDVASEQRASEDDLEKDDYSSAVVEPWKGEQEIVVGVKPTKLSEDQEEEDWLDALEAGELDDFGRVKHEKDTSTMTARQRAMLGHEIEGENELLELPTESRRKDENSEEAVKRRKQRAKKRKQQMEKQIEEDKAQTIDRLLNKQVKSRKEAEKQKRIRKAKVPRVTYLNNKDGVSISFPVNMDVPFEKRLLEGPPKQEVTCAVEGCSNIKRYSCSKTKLPLCSLECYKKVQRTNSGVLGLA